MAGTKVEMPPLHVADSLAGGVGGGTASSSTSTPTTTISAAADSSDNQPSTPQPVGANEQQQQQLSQSQQQQQQQQQQQSHHPYATHHMYASSASSANSGNLPHMYAGMYSTGTSATDLQQQQLASGGYPSYLNSYDSTYYQQPPTTLAAMDYGNGVGGGGSSSASNSSSLLYGGVSGSNSTGDYKPLQSGVRYHPYLHTPTSGLHASSNNVSASSNGGGGGQHQILNHASGNITSPQQHHLDEQSAASTPNSANSAAVSTTTSLSPRVVSSSSPSSTSQQQQQQHHHHHATSPSCTQLQCKKCGIMCTNDAELAAHFANMHGGGASSPYGSAYSSGQQPSTQQQSGGNPGEILDLDSQKMVYPPTPGEYQQIHAAASSDPLHSMHSMQQRALASWEQPTQQQQQEGLPPYLQSDHKGTTQTGPTQPPHANQSPYYSPKQSSPYHSIKSEFPVIKTEYAADSQNYVDKSFDPTAANELSCQQQALLPVSSSPAEFPTTTTTTQQDQQQQQQYRAQFEPPTSSSVLPASSITAKAATWKSNEARRPKTYNCTACNKWFTSSGHLKRHYNTTLHKNAVKSSGQPDPATLPISAHHHPARDPTTKQSRRVKVDAAAREQQQQAPVPVQPPEPPRSPPEYVSAQSAGLAALSHYSTSPSPTLHGQVNGMSYAQSQQQQQQQQSGGSNNNTFQQQYLQQVQATASNAAGASNATVLNGHPNGLAGPSVHQQQQTLTSSQMRGLLNSTTTTIVTKSEPMEDQQLQQSQPQHSPMDMHMEMELTPEQQQQQQQDHQDMQLAEMEQVLQQQQQAYQLELDQQQQQRPFHSSTPSSTHSSSTHSMRAQSPHIISHQQYLEQLQQQQQPLQQQQQMEDNIFCHTPHTPASTHMPPQQQQQYSIMAEQQQYNITILDTNTIPQQLRLQPQHNSNNMSPPLQHTTTTTATISSMDSIRTMPHSQQLQRQHHHRHHPPHIMPNTLLHNSTNNTLEQQQPLPSLDTIRNTIHTLTTTPNTPMPIPSFQQLQQQAVPPEEVLEADHTMSYHTIIGKPYQLHANDQHSQQLLQLSGQFEHYTQMLTTDGQLVQLIPAQQLLDQQLYRVGTAADSYAPLTPYSAQRSPQEGDLPPSDDDMQALESSSSALNGGLPAYSPTDSNCSTLTTPMDNYNNTVLMPADAMIVATDRLETTPAATKPKRSTAGSAVKRKRNTSSSSSSTTTTSTPGSLLPSGRIKCQQCEKTFAKNCYLTQHINCFHAGEYPFRCEKCGKRFQLEEPYTVHLERHKASEKAHKCHLCPKHYHHKTDLRRHIEGTHTQKKPHACEICDKSFCRYDHLLKHMDTHNRPRVVGKRAAANNKIKAAFESAAHSVETSDNVATSIDNVVSNNNNGNYSAIVHVQTHNECDMRNVANADAISVDQKMLLNTVVVDDHEAMRENTDDDGDDDDGGNSTYALSNMVEIKQEYMVEQEIAMF